MLSSTTPSTRSESSAHVVLHEHRHILSGADTEIGGYTRCVPCGFDRGTFPGHGIRPISVLRDRPANAYFRITVLSPDSLKKRA